MGLDLGISGKVAVVTGGSTGIGKATATRLAREGAIVVVCGRDEEKLQKAVDVIRHETGQRVKAIPADVSDISQVKYLFSQVRTRVGPIAILINNAGTGAAGRFQNTTDQAWQDDLELKLFGAIRCAREALPDMQSARWGRIVNLTAISGKSPGAASMPTSISRAAGIALTKALSKEVAAEGITVNTVCIGWVKSAQLDRTAAAQHPGKSREDAYRAFAAPIPVGRVAEAEEAADLIAFLASDRAAYITGTAINFDGGISPAV